MCMNVLIIVLKVAHTLFEKPPVFLPKDKPLINFIVAPCSFFFSKHSKKPFLGGWGAGCLFYIVITMAYMHLYIFKTFYMV